MKMHKYWLIALVAVFLLIDKSEGGAIAGAVATAACGGVCAACAGAAGSISAALLSNPITAPFASVLTPWFANGCWVGFGTCYSTCVGGALVAPTP